MALALPGPVTTVVTAALTASSKLLLSGLMASMPRSCGVTGSVISLRSSPSKLSPSSARPMWQWASIKPGSRVFPFRSKTSSGEKAEVSGQSDIGPSAAMQLPSVSRKPSGMDKKPCGAGSIVTRLA